MSNITAEVLAHIRNDAKRLSYKFRIPYDETLSISFLALVKADKDFKEEKSVPFLPFARQQIFWEHLDENRRRYKFRNSRKSPINPIPTFRELLEEDLTFDGVSQLEARDFLQQVENKICKSRSKKRDILRLFLYTDLGLTDIAKINNISKQAVCQFVSRFKRKELKKLKKEFLNS